MSRKSSDKEDRSAATDTHNGTNRRSFLHISTKAAMAVCSIGAVAGSIRFAVPDFSDGKPKRFPIGKISDYKMNTLSWLRDKDLFIKRTPDGIGAFSARCTHLGCTVRRTSDGFTCPCHGATFDETGAVTSGPARKDLPWYPLRLEADGLVWIDINTQLESGSISSLEMQEEEA